MRKIIAFIAVTILYTSASALNIQESLVYGYDNYDNLKISKNEFIKSIEHYSQAFSGFLPTLALSIDVSDKKSKDRFADVPTSFNEQSVTTKGLAVSQNLFRGGVDLLKLRTAQSIFRSARAEYYAKEQEAFLELVKIYLDCYEAKETFEASEANVRINKQQLASIEERLRLGEATRTDLAAARSSLASAETDRLDQYAKSQEKRARFVKSFGVEPDGLEIPQIPEGLPSSFEEFERASLEFNPSIDASKHGLLIQKSKEKIALGYMAPTVDLQFRPTSSNYSPVRPGGNSGSTSMTSTLSVNIPIYQAGSEYSRIRAAKNDTRKSVIVLDSVIKEVQTRSVSLWEGFNTAKSAIIAANSAVEAAQIACDGTTHEEKVGNKTILDVLTAQKNLYDTKVKKIATYKGLIITAYQLKSLSGMLTARALDLHVDYFVPEEEFKKLKKRLFVDKIF